MKTKTWYGKRKFSRWITTKLLRVAETLFLYAHGWHRHGETKWLAPEEYPSDRWREVYDHGHAVNSTKYYRKKIAWMSKLLGAFDIDREDGGQG